MRECWLSEIRNVAASHLHLILIRAGMTVARQFIKGSKRVYSVVKSAFIITVQEHSADSKAFTSFQLARIISLITEREIEVVIDIVLPC